jgi:hypothetical protein
VQPLDFWDESPLSHSYALSLARYYAKNILTHGRNVLIVPAAHSGSSILEWLGLEVNGLPLYSDMIARTQVGLNVAGSVIVGWWEHQGEGDMFRADQGTGGLIPDAAAYQTYKLQFIDQVRGDLGTFPMFFGLFTDPYLFGSATKADFEDKIRAISGLRTQCAAVETAGVHANDENGQDPIHFSHPGQEELARRHYRAYCEMVGFPVLTGFTNDGLRGSNQ